MKLLVIATCALLAIAVAAPAGPETQSPQILRSEVKQEPDGSYTVLVETDDGITRQETGELVEVTNEEGKKVKVIIVRGSYSYTNPDGTPELIKYVADQDGFHPEGDSIPKNPEPVRR